MKKIILAMLFFLVFFSYNSLAYTSQQVLYNGTHYSGVDKDTAEDWLPAGTYLTTSAPNMANISLNFTVNSVTLTNYTANFTGENISIAFDFYHNSSATDFTFYTYLNASHSSSFGSTQNAWQCYNISVYKNFTTDGTSGVRFQVNTWYHLAIGYNSSVLNNVAWVEINGTRYDYNSICDARVNALTSGGIMEVNKNSGTSHIQGLYILNRSVLISSSDTTSPTYNQNSTNGSSSTKYNESIWLAVNFTDDVQLQSIWLSIQNESGYYNMTPQSTGAVTSYLYNTSYRIDSKRNQAWNWRFYGNDSSGNLNQTTWSSILINNTAPILNSVILNATDSPLNKTTANLTCYNGSITDLDNDVITLYYFWYKNLQLNKTGIDDWFVDSANITKGENWTCGIIPSDSYSNGTMFNSSTIMIQNTLSSINFTSPTELNNSIINRNFILINVSFIDIDNDLKNITIFLYNSSGLFNQTNSSVSPLFVNFSSLSDGRYWINATVYDTTSNINSTETRNITLDTTSPSISNELNISQGTFYSDEWVFMNGTITDTNLNTILLSHNFTGSWTNITSEYFYNASANNFTTIGYYGWRFYANDSAGNLQTGSLQQFYIDLRPSIEVVEEDGDGGGSGQIPIQLVEETKEQKEKCQEGQKLWNDECYNCTGQLIQVGNEIKCVTCEEGFEWNGQSCVPISIPFMKNSFFQTNKIGKVIDKISTFLGGGNSLVGFILLMVISVVIVSILLETSGIKYFGWGVNRARK